VQVSSLLKSLSFDENVYLFNQGQIDSGIAKISTQLNTLITHTLIC
jgi:hypothetical protein